MSGNSITMTDPVTGQVHAHWYTVKEGVLRTTATKDGIEITIDYHFDNVTAIRDFLDSWLERESKRRSLVDGR